VQRVSGNLRVKALSQYLAKNPGVAWVLSALWVLVIGGLAFLWNLGSTGLVDETEPLFAEAARQMTVTGDWVTPYFNNETRFDKPPLIYWLMAIAYQTVGVNEWGARLPSALAAIALMGMGFYLLRRFGTAIPLAPTATGPYWLPALIGSALIGLNPLTLVWGRTGVSDMLLSGCMGLALMAFFCGYAGGEKAEEAEEVEEAEGVREETYASPSIQNSKLKIQNSFSPWYFAFYVLIALAVLTKGPVGLVLPGLTIALFLLYVGKFWEVVREMRLFWGVLIILVLSVPWYVLVTLANGEAFIDSFFGYHNLERFTSVVNRHWAPWYFYFVIVFLGFAPWSVYLPVAIARLQFWKRSVWRHQPRSQQLGLFALFWFGSVFGFFTIAVTKLPSYVLPLMPAAAILVALFWSSLTVTSARLTWGIKVGVVLNVGFWLALAGAIVYAPNLLQDDEMLFRLPGLLWASGVIVSGAAIAGLAAIVSLFLLLRRQVRWVWIVNLMALLALLSFTLMPAIFLFDAQRQLPLRQLAQMAVQDRKPGEALAMLGFRKPSIVFYTRQPVIFLGSARETISYLRTIGIQQPNPPAILLLGTPGNLEATTLPPHQYQTIGQAGSYQLVRVSKSTLAQLQAVN
jgi:4-amino-4-deoxy-L-arabinose transferase-like glycosyltransferase